MRYWIISSKRKPKLWKPKNKDDFYDGIYDTKENAESVLTEEDKKYYGAFPIDVQFGE